MCVEALGLRNESGLIWYVTYQLLKEILSFYQFKLQKYLFLIQKEEKF